MEKNTKKTKLHLGCGNKFIPGFIHVDVVKFEHVDIITNIDNLFMVEDDSVDLIYACHVLEHFNRLKIKNVLLEWRRVLKPGGILRLAVPDFEKCGKLYTEGKVTLNEIHGLIMGGQTYLYNFHYTIFDFETLRNDLIEVGFKSENICKWNWRNTEHAHIDDFSQAYLPHMDKENGILMSLNVEAKK